MSDLLIWVVLGGINLWVAWNNHKTGKRVLADAMANAENAAVNKRIADTNQHNHQLVHEAQLQVIAAYDVLIAHAKAQEAIETARRVD